MQILWKKSPAFAVILAILGGILAMSPISYADNTEMEVSENSVSTYEVFREVPVYINGEEMVSRGRLINDTTYMPLRSVSDELEPGSVTWNNGIATVNSDTVKIIAQQGSHYIMANERVLYHDQPIRNIESRIYVPVRLLAKAYSLSIEWDDSTKSVKLYGDPKGLKRGSEYYNETDLYWLSRIIHAESSGEPFLGKIAVGNVVINRKARNDYPNTVKDVIFDKKYGTQFTPVASGTIYNTPSNDSILAAKICLEGYSLNDEMIFFLNPRIATNFWITNTRTHVMTIGKHKFYK